MKDKQQEDGIDREDDEASKDEGDEESIKESDEDNSDDSDSIKVSERKARYTWSREDVEVLKVAFKRVLNNTEYWPRRKECKAIFAKHPKARRIWLKKDKEDHRDRCLDKVKSLYRADLSERKMRKKKEQREKKKEHREKKKKK